MISATKAGKYGTLYRYRVVYTDSHDAGCPTFDWHCWAYSWEAAQERFNDEGDGWRILSVARVAEKG